MTFSTFVKVHKLITRIQSFQYFKLKKYDFRKQATTRQPPSREPSSN